MNIASQSQPRAVVAPSLDSVEADKVTDETFRRYYLNSNVMKRNGGNEVSIVWFRNDWRVLDNEALYRAWMSSHSIMPVYCIDPRNLGTTHYFEFPKTGGNGRTRITHHYQQVIDGLATTREGASRTTSQRHSSPSLATQQSLVHIQLSSSASNL